MRKDEVEKNDENRRVAAGSTALGIEPQNVHEKLCSSKQIQKLTAGAGCWALMSIATASWNTKHTAYPK